MKKREQKFLIIEKSAKEEKKRKKTKKKTKRMPIQKKLHIFSFDGESAGIQKHFMIKKRFKNV